MTRWSLPVPMRRALALAPLVLGFWALWALVVEPILQAGRDLDDHRAETLQQVARFDRLAAETPALRRDAERLAHAIETETRPLVAPTPSQAAARLQTLATQLLREAGAESVTPSQPSTQGQGEELRATLRIEFRAGIEALQTALARLDEGDPRILVTQGQVVRAGEEALQLRLDLAARVRIGEAAP